MADCLEINAFLKESLNLILLYGKERKCYNVDSPVDTVLINLPTRVI